AESFLRSAAVVLRPKASRSTTVSPVSASPDHNGRIGNAKSPSVLRILRQTWLYSSAFLESYFCSALASPPGNTSTTAWLHTKRRILRLWYPRRHQKGLINMALTDAAYDPFERGRFPVGVRTIEALDSGRNRLFNCEIWYPATVAHAGEDLAFETQDAFSVPNRNEQRRQAAV